MKKFFLMFSFVCIATFSIYAQECKDEITITEKGRERYDGKKYITQIRVVEISKKYIHYKRCNGDEKEFVIRKEDALGIEYANGKWDKFDFDGKNKKKNMNLIRKPSYYQQ